MYIEVLPLMHYGHYHSHFQHRESDDRTTLLTFTSFLYLEAIIPLIINNLMIVIVDDGYC